MATNYPSALDTTAQLKNDASDATVTSSVHAAHHNNISDAIIAIETELGVNPSQSFATVALAVANAVYKTPAADQMIQPSGDFVPVRIRGHASQNIANLLEAQNSAGTTLAFISRLGVLNAAALQVAGSPLASTHLADFTSIAPINSPTFTGNPTAPTPATGDNDTSIATTAFVKAQAYAPLASPTFTGTPAAPTAAGGTNTTQVATTAFVQTALGGAFSAGMIIEFGGAVAPSGWVLCDGSTLDGTLAVNLALWNVIGTTYGGSGQSAFNVPDFRGRVAVGRGTNAAVDTLGENDGVAVANRRPQHRHTPHTHSVSGAISVSGAGSGHGARHQNVTTSAVDGGSGVATDSLNAPAYLVVNKIIKL